MEPLPFTLFINDISSMFFYSKFLLRVPIFLISRLFLALLLLFYLCDWFRMTLTDFMFDVILIRVNEKVREKR